MVRHRSPISIAMLVVAACGGSQSAEQSPGSTPPGTRADAPGAPEPAEDNEFQIRDSDTAADAHGERPSEIEPTATEAAVRFFVIDKDEGPIEGIVIKLTAPDGATYYTKETDTKGYAEVLVPIGQKYQLEYLSLGRRDITASVPVPDEPSQNLKLTLRYKRHDREQRASSTQGGSNEPGFVLKGVRFDSSKATIRPESHSRLDRVVEFLEHKKSARIRIEGHTDNTGSSAKNQTLSEKRAQAVRDYLISKGIDGGRIEAVGYGDTRPVAPNDTEEGRQKNRRIEATEL